MKSLEKLSISGRWVYPLIEGGKGIAVSGGYGSGCWAKAGGVGTFSGVNADRYDAEGRHVSAVYAGKTRKERHFELIQHAIEGGVVQAKIAYETACNEGCIHMNVLWEMGGVIPILEGILERTRGFIHGVTCGAGMPYRVAEIATRYNVYYHPIISSARAFKILWKRAYHKYVQFLGSVVYEDPWLAGGHNGLSNAENPAVVQDPFPRVLALREVMRSLGISDDVAIIMAGGVWCLKEWNDWINNKELGSIAFQFGTRPLLTQESAIPLSWKKKLMTLEKGDILLHKYSPTGFYSSAVYNDFLSDLVARSQRQVSYERVLQGDFTVPLEIGQRKRYVYLIPEDFLKVQQWIHQGFSYEMRTPSQTLIFVTKEMKELILKDQRDCMGCLSACIFSNWSQDEEQNFTTARAADPRSFCIQKSLQNIAHGGNVEKELMFSGHNGYRFKNDPLYANNYIPTVQELVEALLKGN